VIPAGRTAVDREGIAELHGLTFHQARARRPWNEPGHPAPLTAGRPSNSRPRLWDRDQAAAYAADDPIPPLPEPGSPDDLLDVTEAAELAGLSVATWTRYESYERTRTRPAGERPTVPPPDDQICGVPHWYRRTIERFRADRNSPAPAPRRGRPAGATDRVPRADIRTRVAELVDQAHEHGEPVNIAEIARRLGIHYGTAHRYVHQLADTPRRDG
jgi:IclR-like helix-turn-helix domain-containing protein